MTTRKHDPSIPVHIVLVLDESGSMSHLRHDLIGGVNAFLAEQRALPGKCRITMAKFAPYTVVHDAAKIADSADLTPATYNPHSNTPLLDAEGRAITAAMARESARAAAGKKAEAVLFVTFTDGEENASTEWTLDRLTALKQERTEAGWTFLYLGAGHDAYGQAHRVGTMVANTVSTAATSKGVRSTYAGASQVATAYRSAALVADTVALADATHDAYGTFKIEDDEETLARPTS